MGKLLITLLVVGMLLPATAPRAAAQVRDTALVRVPFKFVLDEKLMPAGIYTIAPDTTNWSVLIVSSMDGKVSARFKCTEAPSDIVRAGTRDVKLQFRNYYGQYFLEQVAFPGRDMRAWSLNEGKAQRTLTKLNLMPAEAGEPAR